ncbi:hypothetical protein JKP88DRAFT_282050 [Tribonema minus]|uniref:Uncharacterized protein n=1 Tax=Tribonema minus TaxID=303371 RepID=A0A835YU99_9STRA|nr:hypothetical protein JKP88DRAFT_282050 [Tribonema minus]
MAPGAYIATTAVVEHMWIAMSAFVISLPYNTGFFDNVGMPGCKHRRNVIWLFLIASLCVTEAAGTDTSDFTGGSAAAEAISAAMGTAASALAARAHKKRGTMTRAFDIVGKGQKTSLAVPDHEEKLAAAARRAVEVSALRSSGTHDCSASGSRYCSASGSRYCSASGSRYCSASGSPATAALAALTSPTAPAVARAMVRYMHFLEVLGSAAPGQGVMSVGEAWRIYLRQRAALWFEGVLVFRDFITDPIKLAKCKGAHRSTPEKYKDKNVNILRDGTGVAAGALPRTHGLAQAIVRAVTCKELLWRTHSYGDTDLDTLSRYLSFCWPALKWRLLDDFILFKSPGDTIGGNAGIPVNDCVKCLSTAATLGRLPTCASNCVQLSREELQNVSNRCSNVVSLSAYNSTIAATPPPPDIEELVPRSLTVLLETCEIGVQQWQLSRVEVLFRAMDKGRANEYVEATVNAINEKAVYTYDTIRHHTGLAIRKYLDALKSQQASWQRKKRTDLTASLSIKIRDRRMVAMGRLPPDQDAGVLFATMMDSMLRRTWHVFESAIAGYLKMSNMSFDDFDSLDKESSLVNILINIRGKPAAQTGEHLRVRWVHFLAEALLKTSGFTINDVARLELLAHIFVLVNSPVRPQALFNNKASLVYAVKMQNGHPRLCQSIDEPTLKKVGARRDSDGPLPTSVPLPAAMTRMYLTVLFVCRAMREIMLRLC